MYLSLSIYIYTYIYIYTHKAAQSSPPRAPPEKASGSSERSALEKSRDTPVMLEMLARPRGREHSYDSGYLELAGVAAVWIVGCEVMIRKAVTLGDPAERSSRIYSGLGRENIRAASVSNCLLGDSAF